MVLRTNMQPTTPCLDCGSRLGAPNTPGSPIPGRPRNLCLTCYEYHRQRGTLARFEKVAKRKVQLAPLVGKLRHPGERRAEQRQRIAARVAMHEQAGRFPMLPVVEGDDFDHMQRYINARNTAAAWLRAHPTQTAQWDDPDLSTFPGSAQTDAA